MKKLTLVTLLASAPTRIALTGLTNDGPQAATSEVQAMLQRLRFSSLPLRQQTYLSTRVVSAHVMGGCGMAGRADRGVVRPDGRQWQLQHLSVHDGSLLPTSIGANPQLSVYGLVGMLANGLAREFSGRSVALA